MACAAADAITPSFTGANVSPSPRIIVVTPCVIMLTTRLSPVSSCTYDCAWMSMTPGATTSPRASIRCFAGDGAAAQPAGVMRDDAVADDADVAVEPRVAGAVDDLAVGDDDVERTGRRCGRDARRGRARGHHENCERRGRDRRARVHCLLNTIFIDMLCPIAATSRWSRSVLPSASSDQRSFCVSD